jgi:mannose-6-phosphate isomerase-like protein (cupin superfamily)
VRTICARRSRPAWGNYETTEGDMSSTEQQALEIVFEGWRFRANVLAVLDDFASGYAEIVQLEIGALEHPGEEIIYVLEGSLEYQVEGKPPTTLNAGEVFFVPAGTIHAVRNVGSGNAAELATYAVEKGKPLIVLVE